jgi:dihydrodipicolinate synthase/N-acetylneuraminate lyase
VTSSYGVPGLKAALDLSGYIGRLPRPPLQPASSGAITDIQHALAGLEEFL